MKIPVPFGRKYKYWTLQLWLQILVHTRCGRQSRIESISMLSASASPFSRRWMIDPCSQGPSTGPVHSFLFSGLYASLLFFRETLNELKRYKICWIQFQTICPKFTCQSVPAPKFFSMTLLYTARSGFPPLSVNACCQSCQMREYEIMHFISSWRCWPDVGYNSTAWGGNLFWRFCNTCACFLKVPLACLGSMAAAVQPNGLGNSQKTFYKTFGTSCRPRLFKANAISSRLAALPQARSSRRGCSSSLPRLEGNRREICSPAKIPAHLLSLWVSGPASPWVNLELTIMNLRLFLQVHTLAG